MVALRADGSTALALGDLETPVLPRSANKPLQAVGLLREGWRPASQEQLALACASHSGEPVHLRVVREVLGDLGEDALGCPAQLPLDEAAAHALLADGGGPTRLHMNCSGKHAAMLATCVTTGRPTQGYLDARHPVQAALTDELGRLAGEAVGDVVVDGCGAPQHALTLPGLARAFSRLVTAGAGTAERAAADAARAHPELVGGTGRDVTQLMAGVPGLLAKDGAEGVYAAALPDGGAVALKIADGAARGRVPVLVAALRVLGADAEVLDALAVLPVLGGGRPVGEVRVAGPLRTSR